MKKEIQETVYLTIKTDAKQPIEIRTLAEWCFIDWGDEAYSPGPLSTRTYRTKGEYKIVITAQKLREIHIIGKECSFAKFISCTYLKRLEMNEVDLRSIELYGCKELRNLSCENNRLTALDLYESPKLCRLKCSYNSLKSLVLWRTTGISYLKCNNNQLVELKFPINNALVYLDCSDNLLSKKVLQKIFLRLQKPALKKGAKIKCGGNPGFSSSVTPKIINKGWEIRRCRRSAA